MDILRCLYYVFAFLYVIVMPSFIVGKTLYPAERLAIRTGLGMAIYIALLAIASFAAAMLLHTHVSQVLLFSIASVVTVGGMTIRLARLRRKPQVLEE
jgi:hypothetical protein